MNIYDSAHIRFLLQTKRYFLIYLLSVKRHYYMPNTNDIVRLKYTAMNHHSNKDNSNDDDDSEICFKKKKFAQENVIYLLSRSCALFHNCLS